MSNEFNCKLQEDGKLFVDVVNSETMMFEVSGFEVEKYYNGDGKHCYDAMTVQLTKQDVRKLVSRLELFLNE